MDKNAVQAKILNDAIVYLKINDTELTKNMMEFHK